MSLPRVVTNDSQSVLRPRGRSAAPSPRGCRGPPLNRSSPRNAVSGHAKTPHHGERGGPSRGQLQKKPPMTDSVTPSDSDRPILPELARDLLNAAPDAAIVLDDSGRIVEWNDRATAMFGWSREETVGRELDELIIPDSYLDAYRRGMHAFRETFTGPVLQSRQELTALHRSGDEFPVELLVSTVRTGNDAFVVGYVRDTTEAVATRQQLGQQVLESELLHQATTLSAATNSFDEALHTCLDILCRITQWPIGHVFIVSDSGTHLESSRVWHLEDPERFAAFRARTESRRLRRGEGFAGRIWETGQAEWTADLDADAHVETAAEGQVRGAFGFPVKVDDEIVAVMEFFTPQDIASDPQFLRLVSSLGEQLGHMMERRRLQEERTRQAAIVDSSFDAIIGRNLAGEIVSWNAGAERVYGWSADDALQGGLPLILPEGTTEEEPELADAVRHGQPLRDFRTTRRRSDGTEVQVAITVSPIRDTAGQLIGASTIERDITQLAVTQRELEASEEQARLLLQSTAEAIYGVDLDGNCTFCNPACVRMLGREAPEELLGRNMHELIHHTRADGTPCPMDDCRIFQAFCRPEGTHADDEVLWRRDGTSFPAEYWSHPIVRDGCVVGAVVTFLDITERRQLEEHQARLASIVASSIDGIIVTDARGSVVEWNRGAELIYGYSEEDAVGQPLSFLLPPGLPPHESRVLHAIRNGEELTQFETVRWRKDEKIIDVSITVTPIRTPQGRLVGASTFDRDITSRRQREKELEQARDAAEAANRAKSEFLANISHELRTPMNAIIGMTDLALREPLAEDVRDCLQTARDSADTLLFLLNDILDFSRMEAGRFELEPVDFHLQTMIHDTVKPLSLRADEKGLELTVQVDPQVPDWLRGDAMRLRQIVSNLVTNAVKFTEQGEIVVCVDRLDGVERAEGSDGTERLDEERPAGVPGEPVDLHLAVTDTGIGISAEDQRRIFSPFTQADASSTRRYAGTGLGLTICRSLTALMGGRLWVDSTPGEGSTFHASARMQVAEASGGQFDRSQKSVARLHQLPVLVVDDNATNRRVVSAMLADWSLQPTICENADQAMTELRRAADHGQPFPLILVDALMPGVDGFMLIERIRSDAALRHATILMLSSADRQLFRERCAGLPVSAYVEKPVSPPDLLDAILTAVQGSRTIPRHAPRTTVTNRPLRVLVAEDTPANQKVITRILSKRGHDVQIAVNGRECVDHTLQDTFDAVLMDVQMPIMDGIQATNAIRQREQQSGHHLPIIAMTAHAMRGDREECLAAGMDEYVSKPIDAEHLIQVLESVAGSPALADAEARPADRASPETQPDIAPAPGSADAETPTGTQATGEASAAVWDESAALRRLGNDRELLNDLIDYFHEDAPELLTALNESLRTNNAAERTRAAHSLKGLCGNFEARTAVQLAADVQALDDSTDPQHAAGLVSQLQSAVQQLAEQLALWQSTS